MSVERSLYYDRDGIPVTQEQGTAMFALENNRTVSFSRVLGGNPPRVYEVSTVHLVINHSFGDGPPLIFETMVFAESEADAFSDDCERYTTERQAREGHVSKVVEIAASMSAPVVMDVDPAELHASRIGLGTTKD